MGGMQISALSAMAQDIVLSRNLSQTIDRVMYHIGQVFAPRTWSLLLRDSKKGTLKFIHATGPGASSIRGQILERGQGVAGWVAEQGRPLLIADAPSNEQFYRGIDELSGFVTKSIIAVPLRARNQVYGVIELINKLDESIFTNDDLVVLQTIADFAAIAIERAYYVRAVKRLALTDSLTGLQNRRAFEQVLDREIEKAKRHPHQFAVLLLDINQFKSINDRHGHQAGDEALKIVGRILLSTARKADLCARLGGDEFAVLLPDTGPDEAPTLVARIHHALEDHNRTAAIPFTVSIGARVVDPERPEDILAQADQAMYEAKALSSSGKDGSVEIETSLRGWFETEGQD